MNPLSFRTLAQLLIDFQHVSIVRRSKVSGNRVAPQQVNGESLDARILLSADWGDAPTPYPTLAAEGGAQHTTGGTLRLGASVDSEANGIHSANADGDGAVVAVCDAD